MGWRLNENPSRENSCDLEAASPSGLRNLLAMGDNPSYPDWTSLTHRMLDYPNKY